MRSSPKYNANPTATPPASPSGTPPMKPSLLAPPAAIPNRNSTTSDPSRNTANATTASRIAIELEPAFTESVTRCICCTISLPWLDIQVTCQPIITTAVSSTAAWNTSCPTPPSEPSMKPMHTATTIAPITPSAMPPPTNTLRRGTPRVAAATTVTINAASRTSRKTSSAMPNMSYSATSVPVVAWLKSSKNLYVPLSSGPTNTVMVLFGSTIFSRLKSALSNSEGVALRLVTSTLNLVLAGTFSDAGSNLWFCRTRWNSGALSACAGNANAAAHATIRTGNHCDPRIAELGQGLCARLLSGQMLIVRI